MKPITPTVDSQDWLDFAEPSFGLTALGAAQQLAICDGGWTTVAERGGALADPWVRSFALGDDRLAIIGFETFRVATPGHVQSTYWPLGALRPESATVDHGANIVWVAGVFSPHGQGDAVHAVVSIKVNP
jgi:hypothetical protein